MCPVLLRVRQFSYRLAIQIYCVCLYTMMNIVINTVKLDRTDNITSNYQNVRVIQIIWCWILQRMDYVFTASDGGIFILCQIVHFIYITTDFEYFISVNIISWWSLSPVTDVNYIIISVWYAKCICKITFTYNTLFLMYGLSSLSYYILYIW